MSDLTVYLETDARRPELRTADTALMAGHLAHTGILYERWTADTPLPACADGGAVLQAYAASIDRLKQARRFCTVDVVRVTPKTDGVEGLRAKFLYEHTHAEDEARFFVEGAGAFYIHLDRRVFRVLCGTGDLLSIPAGTPHWFDMGPRPRFTALRLFMSPDGWVARFTGTRYSAEFPKYEMA